MEEICEVGPLHHRDRLERGLGTHYSTLTESTRCGLKAIEVTLVTTERSLSLR